MMERVLFTNGRVLDPVAGALSTQEVLVEGERIIATGTGCRARRARASSIFRAGP
ncbi:hypothetical protein QWZ10_21100 [Paracoccus cavernae]|uniref:Dihydroorotase n=1 Tax=Paracoccus cavernae TaxID=1571207 RepID=A0ABT8DE43_9RHOB|nr:hypothetical protein [Paracoccus cavernae]